jgi:hypothetical protein
VALQGHPRGTLRLALLEGGGQELDLSTRFLDNDNNNNNIVVNININGSVSVSFIINISSSSISSNSISISISSSTFYRSSRSCDSQ